MVKLTLTLTLTLILLLTACAPLARMDADLARFDGSDEYACAAWLRGLPAVGPAPTLRHGDDNFYDTVNNEIVVRPLYNLADYMFLRGHELNHAVEFHNGVPFDERWADYVGRQMHACAKFGPK